MTEIQQSQGNERSWTLFRIFEQSIVAYYESINPEGNIFSFLCHHISGQREWRGSKGVYRMSVDFRSGLKKTGLASTVTRSDTETAQAVAVGTQEPKVTLSKTVDTTQIKSDDLQTKLAVRRA
jgi:hypothetical protein